MGRESECICTWGTETATVKALLESTELLLRGQMRRRIAFKDMSQVQAQGATLRFTASGIPVQMKFPAEIAAAWAKRINSPPSLATKLGITATTGVFIWGEVCTEELREALATGRTAPSHDCGLTVASVATNEELAAVLHFVLVTMKSSVPLWIVYPKGRGHPISEAVVRDLARTQGFMDTKVASVSPTHTALRFTRQK